MTTDGHVPEAEVHWATAVGRLQSVPALLTSSATSYRRISAMSSSPGEKRSAPRQVLRTKAQLLLQGGLLLNARTLNLSSSGMAIVTDGPIAPGTTFMLRCLIGPGGTKAELITKVRSVHSVYSRAEAGFVTGLAFVSLSVSANELITSALRALA